MLVQWLLYSSLWIALCAVAFCFESMLVLQTDAPAWNVILFVFSGTICHYNVHYFFRTGDKPFSQRDVWSQRHRAWHLIAIAVAGIIALYSLFWFSLKELAIIGIATVFSLLYSLPILPSGVRLKQFGTLKPIILAIVWSIITVWLPSHQADPVLLMLVIGRRFAFMLVLCLAFDLRDVIRDEQQGIRTIPVRWGEVLTYRLIDFLLVVFVILAVLVELKRNRPMILLALLASALLTRLIIRKGKKQSTEIYYLGLVDGMMIVQGGFVWLATVITKMIG